MLIVEDDSHLAVAIRDGLRLEAIAADTPATPSRHPAEGDPQVLIIALHPKLADLARPA